MVEKKKTQEEEPKIKLYRIKIVEEVEATSLDEARKQAKDLIVQIQKDKSRIDESVVRVTRAKYSSRSDRLDEARTMIDSAKDIVDELKSEIEEWKDNLPENLQNSEKYSALEECADNLDNIESSLDEAASNCDSVEFPGMY